MIKSSINPILTLDYMTTADENKYFDRKSAKIKVSDIAGLISAFANAEGGTQVIRTNNDSTYLRIGDRTKEIKGKDLRNLEYSKSTRHYEDECNMDAEISDLSEELLATYKKKIGAEHLDTKRVLKARGFIKKNEEKEYLTNAAVLLFAENIYQFYPNCRIRFLRYDGIAEQVGTKINLVKDVNLEYPLLRIIDKAKGSYVCTAKGIYGFKSDNGHVPNSA